VKAFVQEILTKVPAEKDLMGGAAERPAALLSHPHRRQCHLGNINANEVVALEHMRLGLRGDSF